MVDYTISSQVSKILSRFDKTLTSSPSLIKTLEFSNPSSAEPTNQSFANPKNTSPSLQSLQNLYQHSIAQYLKPCSPRTLTPDSSAVNFTIEPRSLTPSSNSSTKIIKTVPQFHPRLNKNSTKIAARLGTAKERLLKVPLVPVIEEESFSFKPTINKKSMKIVGKKTEKEQRWNNLYSQGREKQKEFEKIRLELETEENKKESCPFKPKVLQPSQNTDPNTTIQRLENWAKSKELKIKERKDTEIDKDMRECTFTPKLFQSQLSSEDLSSIKGVNKYVQRGQRIKLDHSQDLSQTSNPSKDMNQKKYKELVQALHDELFSLEL